MQDRGARRGRRAALARLLARHEGDPKLPAGRGRQSCLFSATIPEKVLALSRAFLREPEFVSLVEGHGSPEEIEHFYYVTTAQEKEANLRAHPRVRGSRERDHLLQHEGRRALRDGVPPAPRLRRRPDLRRPRAGRARARDGAHQGRRAALPRRDRRRRARHRHQRPLARDRLRGARDRPRSTCTARAAPGARARPASRSRWCRASTSGTSAYLQKINQHHDQGAPAADATRTSSSACASGSR